MSFKLLSFFTFIDFDGRPCNTLTLPCESVMLIWSTMPCYLVTSSSWQLYVGAHYTLTWVMT